MWAARSGASGGALLLGGALGVGCSLAGGAPEACAPHTGQREPVLVSPAGVWTGPEPAMEWLQRFALGSLISLR